MNYLRKLTLILITMGFVLLSIKIKNENPELLNKQSPDLNYKKLITTNFLDSLISKLDTQITSEQIILSYSEKSGNNFGKLSGFEKLDNKWIETFLPVDVNFGKKGFAKYDTKIEGDRKTPTGIFQIGQAFGYKENINCQTGFIELKENHYWISNPNSKYYNSLVESDTSIERSEKMLRSDQLYEYGLVIRYNMDSIVSNRGSAIFVHVQRSKRSPTAGCISLDEKAIISLISWLKVMKNPIIIMGNKEELISGNIY